MRVKKYLPSLITLTNLFLGFLSILVISCKPIYSTTEFNLAQTPKAPNYSNTLSWACIPKKYPAILEEITEKYEKKDADVFYLYPTLLLDKKDNSWNANIWKNEFRNEVINKAIFYQASAWVKSANLYVPFYRQTHYRIFDDRYTDQGKKAWEIAYIDIKRSWGSNGAALGKHEEVDILIGDSSKAKEKLGWEPKVKFKDLVKIMIQHDHGFLKKKNSNV